LFGLDAVDLGVVHYRDKLNHDLAGGIRNRIEPKNRSWPTEAGLYRGFLGGAGG
jgi:hypothetical protein